MFFTNCFLFLSIGFSFLFLQASCNSKADTRVSWSRTANRSVEPANFPVPVTPPGAGTQPGHPVQPELETLTHITNIVTQMGGLAEQAFGTTMAHMAAQLAESRLHSKCFPLNKNTTSNKNASSYKSIGYYLSSGAVSSSVVYGVGELKESMRLTARGGTASGITLTLGSASSPASSSTAIRPHIGSSMPTEGFSRQYTQGLISRSDPTPTVP